MESEIDGVVLLRRLCPTEISLHGVVHKHIPAASVKPEEVDCVLNGEQHLVSVVVSEREAIALAGVLVIGPYAVPEAAGLADDGQGPVTHGDHLGKSAGLEQAGHKQHIGAGVHTVAQSLVEGDAGAHTAGILPGVVAEHILVLSVARAENCELDWLIQHLLDNAVYEVHTLLLGQAADHNNEGQSVVYLKAELALKIALALELAGHILAGEVMRDKGIGGGVPVLDVDAVHNSVEYAAPAAEDLVHVLAEEGALDLLSVGAADGGEYIGIAESALHEVYAVSVAAELALGCRDVRKPEDIGEDAV